MITNDSLMKKEEIHKEIIYDCIVIGTGTSSEPVLFHLSKTNLNTIVIDGSNLYKNYNGIDKNNKKYISNITPKQIFKNLRINDDQEEINIAPNVKLKCVNFTYIYSQVSGGLSNFWGGGLFSWPKSEIEKTTSLPYKLIKKSYKNISKRLKILNRNQFLEKSDFASLFLSKHSNIIPNIFKPSKFFLSKEGLFKHLKKRDYYDQNIIWKSSTTIREYIKSSNNISYLPNTSAFNIKRDDENHIIYCMGNNKKIFIKSKAVFLCTGVINSTFLAFCALNKREANFYLKHSLAGIIPIINWGFLKKFNKYNIELPDLSWSLLSKNINISGYFISSYFLQRKLSMSKNYFLGKFKWIIKRLLPSLAFITFFTDSSRTKTFLKMKRIFDNNKLGTISIEIISKNNKKDQKILISKDLNKFSKFIKKNFFLINFLTFFTKNGGDIHYGSTMPDENIEKNDKNIPRNRVR